MTASFFPAAARCFVLLEPWKGDFSHFFPSCKCWIIYLPANSQHCQHGVVKIYLCPDKCSSGLQSDYSLLPDILLDAVPVYTVVNHRLPITSLHKTRLVFKSDSKRETETGTTEPMPGGADWMCACLSVCLCLRGGGRGVEFVSSFNAYSILLQSGTAPLSLQ